jgi:hypothetical protein
MATGQAVGEHVDPQDLGGQQRHREAQQGSEQHHQDLGEAAAQRVAQEGADVAVDPPAFLDRRDDRAEFVVGEDQVGRLAGDLGAAPAHGDSDVCAAQAGASFTPSLVIATTCPSRCQAWMMSSFCSGRIRANTRALFAGPASAPLSRSAPVSTWRYRCPGVRRQHLQYPVRHR